MEAVVAASALFARISAVRARAVVAPLAHAVRTASGTLDSAPLVLIDIETDCGGAGRAYVFTYTRQVLRPLAALVGELGPSLVGKALAPADRYADFAAQFRLLGRQGLLGMALSGLDMALWDALAREQGMPLCRLLGGSERTVPAYASFGLIDIAADLNRLAEATAQGFDAVKIKLGAAPLAHDLATVRAVREAIGPAAGLMVDYNQSLTAPEAARRIRALAAEDLIWVEEPVPAEDLRGHAATRGQGCAIQTGENWWHPEDVARAAAAGACDLAMLDVMKIGGVTGWLRAAAQAEGASLPVSSHLFPEASAHLLAVTPNAHFLEHLDLAASILEDPARVAEGRVTPRGPGLGLDWDEAAVARHAA